MRADARKRRTALGLGPITGEMLHHSLNAFTNSQIAANLKHRARPCRKPCLMFHQASSPLDAGVILCRPFEKLFIRLSQNLDLPRSQALDANGRVQVQEDDQVESVLQLKAPLHDGPGHDRALFRPYIAKS